MIGGEEMQTLTSGLSELEMRQGLSELETPEGELTLR